MKTRNGFVSNSSSSSFVVVASSDDLIKEYDSPLEDGCLVVGSRLGETEFGWGQATHSDPGSKINFCYMQAEYVNNGEWLTMLDKVIKENNTKVKIVKCGITNDYSEKGDVLDWGYIDHQSASYEGENTEMFESEDTLKRFLFSGRSYIETDNDNH